MTRTQATRRRVLGVTAGATAVALAGCLTSDRDESTDETDDTGGSGSADTDAGTLGSPVDSVEVHMASVPSPELDPGIVHIETGGTVTWVGEGTRNATASYHPETHGPLRIPESGVTWQSPILREGTRFEVTFDEPGIYDYADTTELCGTHETFGIVGRVVVGQPALDDQPALEHDPEALPGLATNQMSEFNERCREVLGE